MGGDIEGGVLMPRRPVVGELTALAMMACLGAKSVGQYYEETASARPLALAPREGLYGPAIPERTAQTAACVRSETPSFFRMLSTCVLTVARLMKRTRAICSFVRP